eukprot:CAMPEP_0198114016 /NCGR_PEP_ID=MMETSP1442-20131203/5522_1 /TAXON_ID= /ORGANISM="Craspedostauros australis, Strain CCMP3328" /LENGTH=191 /DNA_ID=CAMNT_0043771229 /DNA_START=92 /DNA_END=667 /DNA_ORIENTATION=+
MKLSLLIAAAAATTTSAFAPQPRAAVSTTPLAASLADEVDGLGNNIAVRDLLTQVESSGLLTQVARSGLLSKAQKAGLSLSKLEPLLALAAENKEILVLVEAVTPELLPLLPKVVELAPAALPLAAQLITIPPSALVGASAACAAGAVGAVVLIPDDTILEVAAQTAAVGALGAAGAASFIGSVVLGKVLN